MDEPTPIDEGTTLRVGIALTQFGAQVEVIASGDDVSATGRPLFADLERPPTPDELIGRVVELARHVARPGAIASVGVAVWGRVDHARGEIADTHYGAEWTHYPFAARLAEALDAPTRLTTGVRASAQAEALLGAGVGRTPLLYAHLGRTVASALVVNGAPLVGAHDDDGRLGHWQTGMDGPRCVCGAHGHLQPLVSAQSLIRLAIGVAADDEETLAAIHRATDGRAEALTVMQLVQLSKQGVRPLREVVDYAVEALAGALANLIVTLDPAITLIGGPLALVDEIFYVWLREQVASRLAGVGMTPEIARAKLEPRGAALGAMLPELG